jgi:hypothetical protein
VHDSFLPDFFLLLAAVAAKLVTSVESVPLEVFEREDVTQDVVLRTDAAARTELETTIALRAAEISEFTL